MRQEGSSVQNFQQNFKQFFLVTNYVYHTISCYSMICSTKINQKNHFFYQDDFQNVYIIEKAPSYLP